MAKIIAHLSRGLLARLAPRVQSKLLATLRLVPKLRLGTKRKKAHLVSELLLGPWGADSLLTPFRPLVSRKAPH